MTSFGAEDFAAAANVPRETLDRLRLYARLLVEWQEKLNLVGPSTLPDLWHRHFLDSAQILDLAEERLAGLGRPATWLDLGSGAGFPALVIAIMGGGHVHLVEKSPRKCQFLRAVAEATAAPVTIHEGRAEDIHVTGIDFVTARAFAPLGRLLRLAYPFFSEDTQALFHKGQNLDEELTGARKSWNMSMAIYPSVTDQRGRIIRVEELTHV